MIGNDWDEILKEELKKDYFIKLMNNVREEYRKKTIFPRKDQVFNAFRYTPYKNVKVVILGQDPYHGVGEAEGLSFSVPLDIKKPPSLVDSTERIGYKIYREALKQGLMLRPLGNVMYFNPPLVITKEELEESLRICKDSIDSVLL